MLVFFFFFSRVLSNEHNPTMRTAFSEGEHASCTSSHHTLRDSLLQTDAACMQTHIKLPICFPAAADTTTTLSVRRDLSNSIFYFPHALPTFVEGKLPVATQFFPEKGYTHETLLIVGTSVSTKPCTMARCRCMEYDGKQQACVAQSVLALLE